MPCQTRVSHHLKWIYLPVYMYYCIYMYASKTKKSWLERSVSHPKLQGSLRVFFLKKTTYVSRRVSCHTPCLQTTWIREERKSSKAMCVSVCLCLGLGLGLSLSLSLSLSVYIYLSLCLYISSDIYMLICATLFCAAEVFFPLQSLSIFSPIAQHPATAKAVKTD